MQKPVCDQFRRADPVNLDDGRAVSFVVVCVCKRSKNDENRNKGRLQFESPLIHSLEDSTFVFCCPECPNPRGSCPYPLPTSGCYVIHSPLFPMFRVFSSHSSSPPFFSFPDDLPSHPVIQESVSVARGPPTNPEPPHRSGVAHPAMQLIDSHLSRSRSRATSSSLSRLRGE